LLEVLAAVALVGLLYTELARAAMQSLRAEGEAERRLQAMFVAEQILQEIEEQALLGTAPPIGHQESERDEFRVVIDVNPLDVMAPLAASNTDTRNPLLQYNGPSLLTPQRFSGDPPLRRIDFSVAWQEGVIERSIRRTTFALDRTAAESILAEIAPQASKTTPPPDESPPTPEAIPTPLESNP